MLLFYLIWINFSLSPFFLCHCVCVPAQRNSVHPVPQIFTSALIGPATPFIESRGYGCSFCFRPLPSPRPSPNNNINNINNNNNNLGDDGDGGYNHPYLFLTHIWKIILPVLFVEDWTQIFMDSSLFWSMFVKCVYSLTYYILKIRNIVTNRCQIWQEKVIN